jgi:hypothetical protein
MTRESDAVRGGAWKAAPSGQVPHTTDPPGVAAELVSFADAVFAIPAPSAA